MAAKRTVALKICRWGDQPRCFFFFSSLRSGTKKASIKSFELHAVDQVEQEIRTLSSLPPCEFIVKYLDNVAVEEENMVCVAYALIKGGTFGFFACGCA